MIVVVQIAFGPVSVWLVSGYSSTGELQYGLGTKSGKLQIAMRKNGCLGNEIRQDH